MQIRHVPVAKADRPKQKAHTRRHRAANKRRSEQEVSAARPRRIRREDDAS